MLELVEGCELGGDGAELPVRNIVLPARTHPARRLGYECDNRGFRDSRVTRLTIRFTASRLALQQGGAPRLPLTRSWRVRQLVARGLSYLPLNGNAEAGRRMLTAPGSPRSAVEYTFHSPLGRPRHFDASSPHQKNPAASAGLREFTSPAAEVPRRSDGPRFYNRYRPSRR
jgi:hypothetical protein